jgi:hypothetical protein
MECNLERPRNAVSCGKTIREEITVSLATQTRSAAADEVNDFQSISIFENDLGPAIARGDFAVKLNGDAVGLHTQRFDQ